MAIEKKGQRNMPKRFFRIAYAMNYLSQAAISLLFPAGALIFGGWLLRQYCGVGSWVMILAIVLGVVLGFGSMISFLLKTSYAIDPTQKEENHDSSGE